MSLLLVRHRVKDYSQWKDEFSRSEELRMQYGLRGGSISRNQDDPHELIVCLECDDLGKAREFMQSQEIKDCMSRAGVIDFPDIYFLEEVDAVPEPVHARSRQDMFDLDE